MDPCLLLNKPLQKWELLRGNVWNWKSETHSCTSLVSSTQSPNTSTSIEYRVALTPLQCCLPDDNDDEVDDIPAVTQVSTRVHHKSVRSDLDDRFCCEDYHKHVLQVFLSIISITRHHGYQSCQSSAKVNPFPHGVCMLRECIYGECGVRVVASECSRFQDPPIDHDTYVSEIRRRRCTVRYINVIFTRAICNIRTRQSINQSIVV